MQPRRLFVSPRSRALRAPALLLVVLAFVLASGGPSAHAQTFAAGSRATVAGTGGECLRVRSAPSLGGSVLTCLPEGATVTIAGGTQEADGVSWVRITSGSVTGWVASTFLRNVQAPGGSQPSAPAGELIGEVPAGGGFGLIVFSPGGPPQRLAGATRSRGCELTSVWTTRSDGSFVGFIFGAPEFVNRDWLNQFGGDGSVPPGSPLIIVCPPGGSVPPPPPPGSGIGALPPGVPRDVPPGPAGNQ